jgi:energy-coupling factor transporter transmembrane protein EcfT
MFLLICIFIAALVVGSLAVLGVLLFLTLLSLLAGGIAPGIIWRKLRWLFGIIVILFVLQCLLVRRGEPVLVLSGAVLVTDHGLQTAAAVCLRLLIIILDALLVSVGEERDYLLALTQCKIPYKIAYLLMGGFRFLPLVREEAREVLCNAHLRGMFMRSAGNTPHVKKPGPIHQAGAHIAILRFSTHRAIRRLRQRKIAMEARGFKALPRRASLRRLHMRVADWVYLALCCVILAALFVIPAYFF